MIAAPDRGAAEPLRAAIAWQPLAVLMVVRLVLHGLASGPLAWGYMTDELDCSSTASASPHIECAACMAQLDAQAIYLCRHVRQPLRELWPTLRIYR